MEGKGTENGLAAMAACYKKFDPAAYLQYNYTPPRADFERKDSIVPWKLACLHQAFNEGERIWGIAHQCTHIKPNHKFNFMTVGFCNTKRSF